MRACVCVRVCVCVCVCRSITVNVWTVPDNRTWTRNARDTGVPLAAQVRTGGVLNVWRQHMSVCVSVCVCVCVVVWVGGRVSMRA